MEARKTYLVLGHTVTPLETLGDYGMVQVVSPPNVPGPPPHFHDAASEFFYVADGQLDVMVDGEWRCLQAGQSLSIPAGTVHTLRNTGDRDCRWITGWSPRGFERFFVDFGVDATEDDAAQRSVTDEVIRRVVTECSDYGMILSDA